MGRQLLIYLAEFLARGYGRDQRITRLLNTTEVSTELVTQIFLLSNTKLVSRFMNIF